MARPSLAEQVTMPLIASSTVIVSFGFSPSSVGACAAAWAETCRRESRPSLSGEHRVERRIAAIPAADVAESARLVRRLGRVGRRCGDRFAKFLGLIRQHWHLRLHELGLEPHHFFDGLRARQLLGELKRGRDVLFGERHCLLADILGARLGYRSLLLALRGGFLGGGDKAVERFFGIFEAIFGNLAHSVGISKFGIGPLTIIISMISRY